VLETAEEKHLWMSDEENEEGEDGRLVWPVKPPAFRGVELNTLLQHSAGQAGGRQEVQDITRAMSTKRRCCESDRTNACIKITRSYLTRT